MPLVILKANRCLKWATVRCSCFIKSTWKATSCHAQAWLTHTDHGRICPNNLFIDVFSCSIRLADWTYAGGRIDAVPPHKCKMFSILNIKYTWDLAQNIWKILRGKELSQLFGAYVTLGSFCVLYISSGMTNLGGHVNSVQTFTSSWLHR